MDAAQSLHDSLVVGASSLPWAVVGVAWARGPTAQAQRLLRLSVALTSGASLLLWALTWASPQLAQGPGPVPFLAWGAPAALPHPARTWAYAALPWAQLALWRSLAQSGVARAATPALSVLLAPCWLQAALWLALLGTQPLQRLLASQLVLVAAWRHAGTQQTLPRTQGRLQATLVLQGCTAAATWLSVACMDPAGGAPSDAWGQFVACLAGLALAVTACCAAAQLPLALPASLHGQEGSGWAALQAALQASAVAAALQAVGCWPLAATGRAGAKVCFAALAGFAAFLAAWQRCRRNAWAALAAYQLGCVGLLAVTWGPRAAAPAWGLALVALHGVACARPGTPQAAGHSGRLWAWASVVGLGSSAAAACAHGALGRGAPLPWGAVALGGITVVACAAAGRCAARRPGQQWTRARPATWSRWIAGGAATLAAAAALDHHHGAAWWLRTVQALQAPHASAAAWAAAVAALGSAAFAATAAARWRPPAAQARHVPWAALALAGARNVGLRPGSLHHVAEAIVSRANDGLVSFEQRAFVAPLHALQGLVAAAWRAHHGPSAPLPRRPASAASRPPRSPPG